MTRRLALLIPVLLSSALIQPLLLASEATSGATAEGEPKIAADDAALMAAARTADAEFQRHLELTYVDLDSDKEADVIRALRTFGRLDVLEAVPMVMKFADGYHQSPPVVAAACETLAELHAVVATSAVQKLLAHDDAGVRAAAQKTLTRLDAMATPLYLQRGEDSDNALRASAVTSLGILSAAEATALLTTALRYDSQPHIRRMAAIGLGRMGDPANADVLIESLSDSNPGVRARCAQALAVLDVKRAIPFLIMALEGNVSGTPINAALMRLSGQDFGFDPRANVLDRRQAIETAFEWWAQNAKSLQQ